MVQSHLFRYNLIVHTVVILCKTDARRILTIGIAVFSQISETIQLSLFIDVCRGSDSSVERSVCTLKSASTRAAEPAAGSVSLHTFVFLFASFLLQFSSTASLPRFLAIFPSISSTVAYSAVGRRRLIKATGWC